MTMRTTHWVVCLLLYGLCMSASAHADSVRAWLDRNSMQLDETVTLNVEVDGNNRAAQPDFSPLSRNFNLLGTQSSTSFKIVNGKTSSKLLWAVALQPKHAGKLTIPVLDVDGMQTKPITLTVSDNAPGNGNHSSDLYIQTLLEPHAPYVQQQVRLTVKLYYAVHLTDGNLSDPQANGLVVTKLGQDNNYRAVVGGKQYSVVERHYALLPEKSGKITVPAIQFRGHVLDPRTIDLFMNNGRVVSTHSQPVTVDVRPRPANSGNGVWLPARSVTLTATGIDANTQARVGTPLTLTLRLEAQGLGFEQLPELKLPDIDGADVYPDKATTRNRNDGEWEYGDRERKFAIVPNRPGKLILPPISIQWWDTAHDREATAEIPSHTIDVLPAAGGSPGSTPSATSQPSPSVAGQASTHTLPQAARNTPSADTGAAAGAAGSAHPWRMLAIAITGLWLLTLLAWGGWAWRSRRQVERTPTSEKPDTASAPVEREFRDACKREDWATVARSLLRWARVTQPGVHNLGELTTMLDDAAQIESLRDLERVRYGGGHSDGLAGRLGSAFALAPKMKSVEAASRKSALPPLYPFRTKAQH